MNTIKIIIKGNIYNAVLKSSFMRSKGFRNNKTKLDKCIEENEFQIVKIKNRKRYSSFIVIDKDAPKLPEFISDKNGVFSVVHEGKAKKVQFPDDYRKQKAKEKCRTSIHYLINKGELDSIHVDNGKKGFMLIVRGVKPLKIA